MVVAAISQIGQRTECSLRGASYKQSKATCQRYRPINKTLYEPGVGKSRTWCKRNECLGVSKDNLLYNPFNAIVRLRMNVTPRDVFPNFYDGLTLIVAMRNGAGHGEWDGWVRGRVEHGSRIYVYGQDLRCVELDILPDG